MRIVFLAALCVLGCGGQTRQTQETLNTDDAGSRGTGMLATDTHPKGKVGKQGDVCRCGQMEGPDTGNDNGCKAVECAEGLVCGYGCGIPGCDFTCMTKDEFEKSKTIP